jgi:fimbrial isopeptide formation D2 family protein/LPXTG-motif cell wall-anchored protein
MRKTKKAISILLTLLMVVGMMSTFAFAAGSTSSDDAGKGKITISGKTVEAKTYSPVKVFDVTYDTTGTAAKYGYTIDKDNQLYGYISKNAATLGLRLKSIGNDTYSVEMIKSGDADSTKGEEAFSAAKFAKLLKDEICPSNPDGSNSWSQWTDDNGVKYYKATVQSKKGEAGTDLVFEALPLGYYLVVGTAGALCNLTTTDPEVTINDKNDKPEIEKEADKESANVGDTVKYTITGKVPDLTGYTSYTYTVKDTMSQGLTLDKDSFKVTFGEGTSAKVYYATDLENQNRNKIYSYVASSSIWVIQPSWTQISSTDTRLNGFALSLDLVAGIKTSADDANPYKPTEGTKITIEYSATINENAVTVVNNEAKLTYSNDPADTTATGTDNPPVVRTNVYNLNINKVDSASNVLEGAEFKLYKLDSDSSTKLYYKSTLDSNNKLTKVDWVKEKEAVGNKGEDGYQAAVTGDIKTTDASGAASFNGIAAGTYYLEEVKAPDGFNPLKEPIEIKITETTYDATGTATAGKLTIVTTENDGVEAGDITLDNTNTGKMTVTNFTGTELPETGGIGTTIFYLLGAILVIGAGVVFVTRRRMHADK